MIPGWPWRSTAVSSGRLEIRRIIWIPELAADKSIPPYWGTLRYDGIIYYGGAVFMLATPVYAVARLLGFPPFPTVPIILRIVSVVGGLLSLLVLYNFAVRNGMRWAGLLASIYLMTDYQFGMWTRMAHPDTLQVLFALFGLVIGLRHAERGDLASLAALGLMCGFVQGAKSGGPWTVPMAFLALLWGLQAAGHKFSAVKPMLGRCMVLGAAALFGYFVSTPYAFTDPYLLRSFWSCGASRASVPRPTVRLAASPSRPGCRRFTGISGRWLPH